MHIKFYTLILLILLFSCSDEPFEGEINTENPDSGVVDNPDDGNEEKPVETIYATARLDGEPFIGNRFEVEIINPDAMRLSFFSDLEQQIYIILPTAPIIGVFTVTSTENSEFMYSGAFVNSVGNISESTFNSIANSGEIEITTFNEETGELSGKFTFDVATFNNNGITISEGEFEVLIN